MKDLYELLIKDIDYNNLKKTITSLSSKISIIDNKNSVLIKIKNINFKMGCFSLFLLFVWSAGLLAPLTKLLFVIELDKLYEKIILFLSFFIAWGFGVGLFFYCLFYFLGEIEIIFNKDYIIVKKGIFNKNKITKISLSTIDEINYNFYNILIKFNTDSILYLGSNLSYSEKTWLTFFLLYLLKKFSSNNKYIQELIKDIRQKSKKV